MYWQILVGGGPAWLMNDAVPANAPAAPEVSRGRLKVILGSLRGRLGIVDIFFSFIRIGFEIRQL